jgi:hypothetical protein
VARDGGRGGRVPERRKKAEGESTRGENGSRVSHRRISASIFKIFFLEKNTIFTVGSHGCQNLTYIS